MGKLRNKYLIMEILSIAGYEHEAAGPFLFESCKNLRSLAITHYKKLYKKKVHFKKVKKINCVLKLQFTAPSLLLLHFGRNQDLRINYLVSFNDVARPEYIIEELKYSLAENDIEIFKPDFMKSLKHLKQLKQIHYTNVRYLYDFG